MITLKTLTDGELIEQFACYVQHGAGLGSVKENEAKNELLRRLSGTAVLAQNGTVLASEASERDKTADTAEIKPCPFCGSDAFFGDRSYSGAAGRKEWWVLQCNNEDCGIWHASATKENARKKWNKRAITEIKPVSITWDVQYQIKYPAGPLGRWTFYGAHERKSEAEADIRGHSTEMREWRILRVTKEIDA